MAKSKTDADAQRHDFIKAARELGCDEDEDAFNRRLKQLASAPPPKSVQKRKTSSKRQPKTK